MKYILFLILSLANLANAATVMEWQEATFTNLLKNPGFENGSAKWTPSVSSTFQIVSGNQALIETRSASFTATAASQTVQSSLYPIPRGLVNGDCESQILYQTNSNVYRMRVLNASGAVLAQQALPAVSSSSVAKMFFPCSVSATTSVRADLISSATAGLSGITWDQNHLGSLISSKTGAVVEAEREYGVISVGAITTAPTKGGVTIDRVLGQRTGNNIFFTYEYRQTSAGVAGNGDYLYSLPAGISFDLTKVSLYTGATTGLTTPALHNSLILTSGSFTDNINGAFAYVSVYSATQFRLLTLTASTAGNFHGSANSPYSNTNLAFKFTFKTPIANVAATSTTFDSRCPNDISCNNVFSFTHTAAGALSIASPLGWVTSCSLQGGNRYVCPFAAGIFTSTPHCTGSQSTNGLAATDAGFDLDTSGTNTSQIAFYYHQPGTGNVQTDGVIICNRTADRVDKRTMEALLSKTVSTTGNNLERLERIRVAPSCTTSPCTIQNQSGAFNAPTRTTTGTYPFTLIAGTFSETASCVASCGNGSNTYTASLLMSSATNGILICDNGAGAAVDTGFSILCMGPR